MKNRTRAVVPERAESRPPARRLAPVRRAAAVAAWGLVAAFGPGAGVQAAMFVLPAGGHAAPATPAPLAARSEPGARGGTSAAADGAARVPGTARNVEGAAPMPAAAAASAESRATASQAGELPSSQSWALLGGVLLAVCMIVRRQRQQA